MMLIQVDVLQNTTFYILQYYFEVANVHCISHILDLKDDTFAKCE